MYRRPYLLVFFSFLLIVLPCAVNAAPALTIFYAGEERGQLSPHDCGEEQVGGLANRWTLIENLYIRHPGAVLNLHTGNLIDAADQNVEGVYQIGLAALEAMKVDVLCLGPNELSLPVKTLVVLHANYPSIEFTCANLKQEIVSPYLIQSVDSLSVAVIGLLSQTQSQSLQNVELIPPENALATLKSEIISKSDFIIVVFHGTQEAARALVQSVPWIDVLIVAGNKQREPLGIHSPEIFTGQTAIVTNVSSGAAVGVLEVLRDDKLQHRIFTNSYHGVSEKIEPNADLATRITGYESHGFGLLTVAVAGLLDGINPCAFATILLFISYMTLVGRKKKEMLITGSAFTSTVFVTYLLLGLGTLSFMNYLNMLSSVATCVYLVAALFTFGLAGLSLYDAVKTEI